jgi:CheY-like chemotaxis protein
MTSAPQSYTEHGHPGRCHSVLVVDDDPAICEAIQQALEEEGYQVITAEHGQAALDWLKGAPSRPCVIILDLMMPVMDGAALRRAQLSDPTLSNIPVILVTAGGNADKKAAAVGADLGMTKPMSLHELLEAVGKFC